MKKLFALLLCLIFAVSLVACSKASDSMVETGAAQDFDYFYDEKEAVMDSVSGTSATGSSVAENEKIIKTVELSVETKEYEVYISAMAANVTSVGGYIESSDANFGNYSYSNRYATYVVRIPADKLGEFLIVAGENGKIISKTESQKNVTFEYVDLESRIEAYKTEKTTLTNLLEKAASLENVLAIQERLSEVNYQIETYTSQLKVLENRVSYSTVTLRINEVERVTEDEPTLWSRIKDRFADNLDELVDGIKNLVVDIVGGLPIIIPVGAVIAVAVLILKKIIKKRKTKRNTN